ncbi:MAG: rRNA cytosine-C5-methyltransferase, partial [Paludibacteraceae bacterium]|nr:rRNA cytosine-C5-methyltransferase [Paludibacteraceae bacterium]
MFPDAFVQDIKKRFGAEADAFLEALNEEPSVSVRLNDKASFGYAERVPWCDTGFYLPERPSFTADPLFHAGAYYVQEAASMFVEQAVKQHIKESVKMLDLCAAPGGKSTHLSSVLPEGSFLVSNEYVKTRANILSENMTKWGAPHVLVTNNKPADFARFGAFFDAMLVD